jgi:DNA adenine methylase
MDGSWGYDKKGNTTTQKINNKRNELTGHQLAARLQNVQIECADALYIIQSRDTAESFFYCDPPYFNSNCGHYDGYSDKDFESLLQVLSAIKGKFLLSSYPSDLLTRFVNKHKWGQRSVEQRISVNKGYGKKKIEVLTANYPL